MTTPSLRERWRNNPLYRSAAYSSIRNESEKIADFFIEEMRREVEGMRPEKGMQRAVWATLKPALLEKLK